MKIAIEAQRIFRKEKHGMDYVVLETIKELQKIDKKNEYFIMVSPGEDRCLYESENVHIIEVKCPTYALWEQIALPIALNKIKPDIVHCTSNTAPIKCKAPLILTLHDIIFLEKKQGRNQSLYQSLGRYYRRLVVPRILNKCRKIITVSNYECQHINQTLHLDNDTLIAVYNGYNSYFKPINDPTITDKYIKDSSYFFFLGNTDPKKNTAGVLEAYSIYLKKTTEPLPLFIADLKEAAIDEYLKAKNIMDIKSMLIYPGYIPNKELPAIYSKATAFIYTSLRESFGIPIIEAMACGTPVITSNTSAMPEIAGKNGLLVNPYKPEEIANILCQLEKKTELYQQQKDYGLNRAKQFSWKNTAKEVLNIYENILL